VNLTNYFQSIAGVKNAWSYVATPPSFLVTCCWSTDTNIMPPTKETTILSWVQLNPALLLVRHRLSVELDMATVQLLDPLNFLHILLINYFDNVELHTAVKLTFDEIFRRAS